MPLIHGMAAWCVHGARASPLGFTLGRCCQIVRMAGMYSMLSNVMSSGVKLVCIYYVDMVLYRVGHIWPRPDHRGVLKGHLLSLILPYPLKMQSGQTRALFDQSLKLGCTVTIHIMQ